MDDLIQRAQNFKEQSLMNFQELSIGKDSIPVASCSEQGNPYVLSRCDQKIYDNRSNVIPMRHTEQYPVEQVKAFNE